MHQINCSWQTRIMDGSRPAHVSVSYPKTVTRSTSTYLVPVYQVIYARYSKTTFRSYVEEHRIIVKQQRSCGTHTLCLPCEPCYFCLSQSTFGSRPHWPWLQPWCSEEPSCWPWSAEGCWQGRRRGRLTKGHSSSCCCIGKLLLQSGGKPLRGRRC